MIRTMTPILENYVGMVKESNFHLMGTPRPHLQHTYAHRQQYYTSTSSPHICVYMHAHAHVHIYIAKPTDQAYLIDIRSGHKHLG